MMRTLTTTLRQPLITLAIALTMMTSFGVATTASGGESDADSVARSCFSHGMASVCQKHPIQIIRVPVL
jgi:hypothetical protein